MKKCIKCENIFEINTFKCAKCGYTAKIFKKIPIYAPDFLTNSDYMPSSYYDKLKEWEDSGFWWFKSRRDLICFLFSKYFSNSNSFCEVGCGGGYVLSGIQKNNPNLKCFGTEVHIKGLQIAKDRLPDASFFQADILNFPYIEEFDGIGAFDVLEHIEDDFTALKNIYLALKPGGRFILSVPQHQWLWTEKDSYSGHKQRYNKNALVGELNKVGFEVVRVTSFTSLLLPLLCLSRLKDKKSIIIEENIKREFNISSMANKILTFISSIENILIKLGLNFYSGGSLFIVCKKK